MSNDLTTPLLLFGVRTRWCKTKRCEWRTWRTRWTKNPSSAADTKSFSINACNRYPPGRCLRLILYMRWWCAHWCRLVRRRTFGAQPTYIMYDGWIQKCPRHRVIGADDEIGHNDCAIFECRTANKYVPFFVGTIPFHYCCWAVCRSRSILSGAGQRTIRGRWIACHFWRYNENYDYFSVCSERFSRIVDFS